MPPLTMQEEQTLAAKVEASGDVGARDELVKRNIPLAVKIAHEFRGRNVELDDLVQVACEGLVLAAERYRPGKGAKFSTYAQFWMHECCKKAVDAGCIIHMPRKVSVFISIYKAVQLRLQTELSRKPTPEEIRGQMPKMTDEFFQNVSYHADTIGVVSISEPQHNSVEDDESPDLECFIVDDRESADENASNAERNEALEHAISTLTEDEQFIIKSYFEMDGMTAMTLAQIGDKYQRSKEWARLKINAIIGKLRKEMAPHGITPKGSVNLRRDTIHTSRAASSGRRSGATSGMSSSSNAGCELDSKQPGKTSKASLKRRGNPSNRTAGSASNWKMNAAIFAAVSSIFLTQTSSPSPTNASTHPSTSSATRECLTSQTMKPSPISKARCWSSS